MMLDRTIAQKEYAGLPGLTKWLYVILTELEHRYTSEVADYFTRTDEQLAEDCGFSVSTVKRGKRELERLGFVETWQEHFEVDGKRSEKHITAYRLKY